MKKNTKSLLSKFQFIGNFNTNSGKNLIKLDVDSSVSKETMKNTMGRIYVFVEEKSNGEIEILKIGKSSDKNGLKGTLGFYVSALSGTPGQNRYCMHYMISDKLLSGSKVQVYVKFVESVKVKIEGLFSSEQEIEIPVDVTYIEHIYLTEYKEVFGGFPTWNFQENGKQLPKKLMENFGNFISNKKK